MKLIVFIDDDYATNVYHQIILEEADISEKYLFFESPVEALKYFKEQESSETPVIPTCIFLDINMPELTGWDFLDEYTKLNLPKSPTVIMLTTSLSPLDADKATKYDMIKDYMNKPLTIEYLEELATKV